MLILTMNIGKERYGIDARRVTEVIPLVAVDRVPMADACILGIFNYRGVATPVVDLCYFFEQRYCEHRMSSRIIIIELSDRQAPTRVGLVAECVTEVIKCSADELGSSGIDEAHAQFLGSVYKHDEQLVQIIDTEKVLPDSIIRQLNRHTPPTQTNSV